MKEALRIVLRREEERDYRRMEEVYRRAFWNVNVPGCNEHYLAHILRKHADYLPELDYVAELDGQLVGGVMYSRSSLTDEAGETQDIVTFGPIGVEPAYQRRGISRRLLEKTFDVARDMGYGAIVIFGNPDNYVARGFKSCMKYNVCVGDGVFPAAMMVKELVPDFFDGRRYVFKDSTAFESDAAAEAEFDKGFEPMEKKELPCQEEFFIHCHSVLRP